MENYMLLHYDNKPSVTHSKSLI